ncbi:MAG: carbon-nitrogen hydrolase [Cytophagales bacterium]|nr:carbon-nitrogen hydrolase [Cytophagales bacterium]
MMRKMTIGTVQLSCVENPNHNLAKTIEAIRETSSKGANVVCLQELFRSLYFCDEEKRENFSLAEDIVNGETTLTLRALAKELEVVIIASLFEKRTVGVYHNTTIVIDVDGTILGKYRKSHIPDDPGFYEKYYFTPADENYQAFETRFGKVGVLICWDQWYPEPARITALKGAEVIFYPTAIGWDMEVTNEQINEEEYNAWQTIQRSHAIANGVYVVAVNRVGQEAATNFWGGSFISNPFGTILYQGTHDEEEVQVTEIDLDAIEYYRQTWPFLRDRRIETYHGVTKRLLDND